MQLSSPIGLVAVVTLLFALLVPRLSTATRWGLLGCALVLSCASLRPRVQEARDDIELACRKLAAAMVGDLSPSKAERIAQKVCLADVFAETIAKEAASDADELFGETLPLGLADAGASGATAH